MNYWLDLFTPHTWTNFRAHGAVVSGFRPSQRKVAFEEVKEGDLLICYVVKVSRWSGLLEVVSRAYEDDTPIFEASNDPFQIRFKVDPKIVLDFDQAIPMKLEPLWRQLSFTRELDFGEFGWGQSAGLRRSLVQMQADDAKKIIELLRKQQQAPKLYELDSTDRRHIERTTVRTEQGEVEVEVPDRSDEVLDESIPTVRESISQQAKVAQLGAALGFKIWIPSSDRVRVSDQLPSWARESLLSSLPINFNEATNRTIENIDVLWLQRNAIMHAFEVEHTTSIYSGLLRMADLLAMQPRMDIPLHIVAPEARRKDVRREILRPVFSVLDGGPMSKRCTFLSYDAIDKLVALDNLPYLRETIIGKYEELFEEQA